jgi:hypothetical protein
MGRLSAGHGWRTALVCIAGGLAACDGSLHATLANGDTAPATETVTLLNRERLTFPAKKDSASLDLRVPAETRSLLVTVEGKLGGAYVVSSWKDDDDKELINFFADQFCRKCANRTMINEAAVTAYLGNHPDVRYAAGEHRLRVSGVQYTFDPSNREEPLKYTQTPAGGFVLISAVANVMPKAPTRAVVDLNFHFTTAAGWSAALGSTNADLNAALARMRALYAQAGIEIGTIRYRDVSSEFDAIERTGGPDSENFGLRASGRETTGINVYFTSLFLDDNPMSNFKTLGISGGIPGPVRNGTPQDGVVIAVDATRNPANGPIDAKLLGSVMAHEIGHYLGLFHTRELTVAATDQLSDTDDNDMANLMYPVAAMQENISDDQGVVMRQNPILRYDATDPAPMVTDDAGAMP